MPKKPAPVAVYITCRFCTQVVSCPVSALNANGAEEMEIRVRLDPLNEHMLRKHERKLQNLVQERENEQRQAETQEEQAQLDVDAERDGPDGVQQDRLLREMGSGEVPAAFRVPGA